MKLRYTTGNVSTGEAEHVAFDLNMSVHQWTVVAKIQAGQEQKII
jgi:hypothetical protein